ncbi:MAG: hypothetical protein J2P25_18005, partial [Nocardiopsaceae bacterium]|nr:hypothetical protein [Nocardiopsaceae bacterium]
EIGPGGGAAVAHLAAALPAPVDMTLIEAPGIESRSLRQAIRDFGAAGSCRLIPGFAQDLASLLPGRADVISASALLHEVYSYGGGYSGLYGMIRTLASALKPGGFFAYRDVYAVGGPTLHEPAAQCYDGPSWLRFLRMWVPYYLRHGTHPYHHADDEVTARQDSRIVPVAGLDPGTCAYLIAPGGLFREIQRHYITLRDHVWRSGILGFAPVLEGRDAEHWIDRRAGHKRVHYAMTGRGPLSESQRAALMAMSETYGGHLTIDGDILDEITDVSLIAFLDSARAGAGDSAGVWESWLAREGRETYAYLTLEELLTLFAVSSAEAGGSTVLAPAEPGDVFRAERHYYDRFLARRLPNPMPDGKQMVLFQNIPLSDPARVSRALSVLGGLCGKRNLARIYTAVTSRGTAR